MVGPAARVDVSWSTRAPSCCHEWGTSCAEGSSGERVRGGAGTDRRTKPPGRGSGATDRGIAACALSVSGVGPQRAGRRRRPGGGTCGSRAARRPWPGTPQRVAAVPSSTTIEPGMRCRHPDRRPPFTALPPHRHVGDGTPWRRSVGPAAARRDGGRRLRRRPARLRPGQAGSGVRALSRRPRLHLDGVRVRILRQPRRAGGVPGGGPVHRPVRVHRPGRSPGPPRPGRVRVAPRLRRR